jgi:Tol biopolymer transport system component
MYFGFGVSPDGKRICFSGYESGLYLATLDEKSMRATVRTLFTKDRSTYVSFAPDGKRVVLSHIPIGTRFTQLYTMDVDTDTKPKRLDGQEKWRHNWAPNWSPDGKIIVFGSIAAD